MSKPINTSGLADVDRYIEDCRKVVADYELLLERITVAKKKAKKGGGTELMDLLMERDQLQKRWIAKKKAARANIALLANESLKVLKEKEVKDAQDMYREVDSQFKSLNIMTQHESLTEGAAARARDRIDVSRAGNDELLDEARNIHDRTTDKLKSGLATLVATKEQGTLIAATLEMDREKIARATQANMEIQSDLKLSQKLITNFIKRLGTDKAIIAFTFVLVIGIVGIIVYASLNPNQKFFTVPEAVKPNIPGVIGGTPTSTPSHV